MMMQQNRSSTCLAKTGRAWEMLPYPELLGRRAHTLMLLANGRRSLRELSLLVGDDVMPMAHELVNEGLLHEQPIEVPAAD